MKVSDKEEKISFEKFFGESNESFCDFSSPSSPPKWLNRELYFEGVKCFWDNVFMVFIFLCQSLIAGLSNPNLSYPLLLTGRSETSQKSFRRYAKTTDFIFKLFTRPPWEQNSVVSRINKFHLTAADKLRKLTRDEMRQHGQKVFQNLSTEKGGVAIKNLDQVMLTSIQEASDKLDRGFFNSYDEYVKSGVTFSNFDMALVQMSFFAPFVINPHFFGCRNASKWELEGLAHVWRVMGYYLGVPDSSNCVLSSFDESVELQKEMLRKIFVPSILRIDEVSLRMSKNMAEAFCIDYHIMIYATLLHYDIELKTLWSHFSTGQKLLFHLVGLVAQIYRFRLVRLFVNWSFMALTKVIIHKARGRKMSHLLSRTNLKRLILLSLIIITPPTFNIMF